MRLPLAACLGSARWAGPAPSSPPPFYLVRKRVTATCFNQSWKQPCIACKATGTRAPALWWDPFSRHMWRASWNRSHHNSLDKKMNRKYNGWLKASWRWSVRANRMAFDIFIFYFFPIWEKLLTLYNKGKLTIFILLFFLFSLLLSVLFPFLLPTYFHSSPLFKSLCPPFSISTSRISHIRIV